MDKPKNDRRFLTSTHMAFIAMFATLAAILYILDFKLTFAFPGFLSFKLSDIPILIGTFTLGPVSGAIIVVVEVLIKLVLKGTSTLFVGELSDVVTSCVFAVTAGIIYSRNRTFKGAVIAMSVATVMEVFIAILFNRFVLVPFYVQVFFNGNWSPLIGMMKPLFPDCTVSNFYTFYIWASVLPFNLLRCMVAILVTLLVYKHISRLINSVNRKIYGKSVANAPKTKKVNIILIVSAAVIVALLVTFTLLRFFVFK